MSDVMMFGIAKMPYEMAMGDEMSRRQFYANTQRLAAALEAAREEVVALEAEVEALRKDAERYRHLFDCPEPFCYRGDVFDSKQEADAAIDAAMREGDEQ